jgi:hypothetical protein
MRIQENTINLAGSLWSVFWYAVYGVALFFIFASRTWLAVKDSSVVLEKQAGQRQII